MIEAPQQVAEASFTVITQADLPPQSALPCTKLPQLRTLVLAASAPSHAPSITISAPATRAGPAMRYVRSMLHCPRVHPVAAPSTDGSSSCWAGGPGSAPSARTAAGVGVAQRRGQEGCRRLAATAVCDEGRCWGARKQADKRRPAAAAQRARSRRKRRATHHGMDLAVGVHGGGLEVHVGVGAPAQAGELARVQRGSEGPLGTQLERTPCPWCQRSSPGARQTPPCACQGPPLHVSKAAAGHGSSTWRPQA